MPGQQAISGRVTGNDEGVGFRAMVMKQAIEYNLAGFAKNEADDVVEFTLQGDGKRIATAVASIREGTKKSSGIEVTTAAATVDPGLKTFTIIDWTSQSRKINTKYNLVFPLRAVDTAISEKEAKKVWHGILKATLDAEDLKKLAPDD